ncbi:hypothetical protein KSP39_PZI010683 [Platanthera zijinensis]|uniref:Conserved oligomeric Golgi complex subunit 8 n=1 Tax=Platanthera zijinensis TaxID=2320716 RepID=A0AAP0G736_9ASPA
MHQIRNHLATLEIMLLKISEGGLLSNILDKCMHVLSIFSAVINLFSKNMSTAVENFQVNMVVLDSHHWVPLPSVGFPVSGTNEESLDDVTPPSFLMEHPPIAVFINGVSAAMNDLRPCAPVSLKHILAYEVVNGLQAVSNSLLQYSIVRVLRGSDSPLFLSLCQAFIEVSPPISISSLFLILQWANTAVAVMNTVVMT